MPSYTDTYSAAYLDTYGVPAFPDVPLNLQCQLNLGGTWTDVSSYAYQRDGTQPPVSITRGRPDQSSQANPAACTWEWNNRDGRFSPKNPVSPYYGMLGRNTPVRWSVPAQQNYLRLEADGFDRAFTSGSRLNLAGSIEMRIALRLTDWRGAVLACKWDGGGCWRWILNPGGTLTFGWNDSAAAYHSVTSTVPVPYASGDFALRVAMDAASGTVTFYTGSTADGTWARLGDAASGTGGAATSVQVQAGSALAVGYSFNSSPAQLFGRVYEYRLYNGLPDASPGGDLLAEDGTPLLGENGTVLLVEDGSGGDLLAEDGTPLLAEDGTVLLAETGAGAVVAAGAVFASVAPGAASWTDSAGNLWQTAGGAEVSARDYRFHGEMSSQPPKWDVTGTDMRVTAAAGGPLRRLSQGTKNAMSALKRAILLQSGDLVPVAYWPMEDAAGATQFGAALGGLPMTFGQSPAPKLASDSSFLASAPLPALNGSPMQAPVPPYAPTGAWTVRFLLKLAAPAATSVLIQVVTQPGAACPVISVSADTSGNLYFTGYTASGSQAFNLGPLAYGALGNALWMSVEAKPVSGGVQYDLVTVTPGASFGLDETATVTSSAGAGNVTLVQPDVTGAFTDTVMGHLQVQSAWTSMFSLGAPLNAWQGETAAARYVRLAGEHGYQARILGSPAQSALMGAQTTATLGALLRECEAADLGQQFEPRQQLALGYRTLASMCNQSPAVTLDYAQSQPGGVNGGGDDSGLDPTYDDLLLANDWTVTRGASGGSQGATWQSQLDDGSALSVSDPPAGAGDYAKTATVNVQYDTQLPDVAGWLVRAGTVDEARWPVIPVNLARREITAGGLYYPLLAAEAGDYLALLNLPDTVLYDPVKQLALGAKESLGGFHHTLEFNAVPEAAYETVILGDPVAGTADTPGSVLYTAVSASVTTLRVYTPNTALVLWTTSASDFPFDIGIGGERMTVTSVTGSGSTQAFTVIRSVNGVVKSQSAGADVRLWTAPILALT